MRWSLFRASYAYARISSVKTFTQWLKKLPTWPVVILGVALVGFLAYETKINLEKLEAERQVVFTQLEEIQDLNFELKRLLVEKEAVIAGFEGQIGNIASTVGTLEKLSQTDEELLKKYSKVYFLNENYRPAQLSLIDEKYLFNKDEAFIQTQVASYLGELLRRAGDDGVRLLILSAFRSFETQAILKSGYKVTYGSGANTFSADQGYSEHQLGTTVDFTTQSVGAGLTGFDKDMAYKWLLDNAHRYGFTLSYPAGNAYYKFEPWHWRFVGVELATWLHEENKHFYDLDQREIDTYLVKLFE